VSKVDAVTQATIHNNIKFVIPIKVASDSATIKWTDAKSRSKSGTVVLSYGTGEGAMTDRPVTKTEATALTFSLKGLTPKTTYKIRLQANHPTNAHEPCADTATITTSATTDITQRFSLQKNIPLEFLDHSVRLGSMAQLGDRIAIVDSKGQTLHSFIVSGSQKAVRIPSYIKGIVFLTCSRNGNMLASKKITIMH